MTRQTLGALITLNLALLVALVVTLLTPPAATAQVGRGRGDYIMISGEIAGRDSQQAVYLVEVKTMRMAALIYNSANNQVTVIDRRDMGADLTAAGGGR